MKELDRQADTTEDDNWRNKLVALGWPALSPEWRLVIGDIQWICECNFPSLLFRTPTLLSSLHWDIS